MAVAPRPADSPAGPPIRPSSALAARRRSARPTALLDRRLSTLARQGYRTTPQRRAILTGMLGAGRENVSADEICRRARVMCPTVNLATTYRTLELFGRLGIIRRLTYGDGRSVFCPNTRPHYHGMCLRCGAVIDVPRGRVRKVLEQEQSKLTDAAFLVVDHRVEFFGYCAGCRGPKSRA